MLSLSKKIIKSILIGDLYNLRSHLRYLPIETEVPSVIDNLFGELSEVTLRSISPEETLEILMDRWTNKIEHGPDKGKEVEGRGLNLLEGMFYNTQISMEVLKLAAKIKKEFSYSRIVNDIIESVIGFSGEDPNYGLYRIEEIYKPKNRKEILKLIDRANFKTNTEVENYLILLVRRNFPKVYAPKPDWILNIDKKPLISDIITPVILNNSEIFSLLTASMNEVNFSITNKQELSGQIKKLNSQERVDIFLSFRRFDYLIDTKIDIPAFNKYGPSNPTSGLSKEDYLNFEDRMVSSTVLDHFDMFGNQVKFDGWCQKCTRAIRYKEYSYRVPIETGGWMGWFCSMMCMRDWIDMQYSFSERSNVIPQINYLIQKFYLQLRKYKIHYIPDEKEDDTNII